MTEYRVLRRTEHGAQGPYWEELATTKARSAKAAIAAAVGELHEGGQFVAVPLRSWSPLNISVETKTSLRFS